MTFDPFDEASGPVCPEPGRAWARPRVVPRGVKRVIDFIDANLGATLAVSDLVAASGVSGRTLFKHFRRFVGLSPMAYLRVRRLERVHDALRRGEAESVTVAALHWGFIHLGRFAGAYVRAYGEPPSATLRRARNDGAPSAALRYLEVCYSDNYRGGFKPGPTTQMRT